MVAIATTASAQIHLGAEAGLNVNLPHDYNNREISSMLNPKNSLGWFLGPKLMYMTPLGFGADGALLFSQMKNDQGESTKSLQYLNVPINLRYQFSLLGLCGIYLAVGPQWSVNIGDRKWNISSVNSQDVNQLYHIATTKHNISANLGFGAIILENIHVGVTWNIPVTNGGELIYNSANYGQIKENWRNNTWQVRVAYFLN